MSILGFPPELHPLFPTPPSLPNSIPSHIYPPLPHPISTHPSLLQSLPTPIYIDPIMMYWEK